MKRLAVVMRDGCVVVTDSVTGEPLAGVWRVELCATGNAQPLLTLYLDPAEHEINVESASVRIDRRHRAVAASASHGSQKPPPPPNPPAPPKRP